MTQTGLSGQVLVMVVVLCFLSLIFSSLATPELEGIDRGVLMRALKLLEQKGKAAIFKGSSTDDDGVKFSA